MQKMAEAENCYRRLRTLMRMLAMASLIQVVLMSSDAAATSNSSSNNISIGRRAVSTQISHDQLQPNFYDASCPNLQSIVFDSMSQAVSQDLRAPASILRLFFHDCFVQGCDGSILLDDSPSIKSEKNAGPNFESVRGFDVIDAIKADVEAECPGVVSCADILALAARDGVVLSGGPSWDVPVGRRDSRTAGFDEANRVLPSPSSDINTLITSFQTHGLSLQDLITLSGAHTLGFGKCVFFRDRLYNNDQNDVWPLNPSYARRLEKQCPLNDGVGDDNLAPLDSYTPFSFDNRYFISLLRGRGLFTSDQTLLSNSLSTLAVANARRLILSYAQNSQLFAANFGTSMINLGNIINPLTTVAAGNGEIRQNCHFVNNNFRKNHKRNSSP